MDNKIQTIIFQSEQETNTEADDNMASLLDEILDLTAAYNNKIRNIQLAIKEKDFKKFIEHKDIFMLHIQSPDKKEYDINRAKIEGLISLCKICSNKELNTAYKFLTNKEHNTFSHSLFTLVNWALEKDSIVYKILEKKSLSITEEQYDGFHSLFENQLDTNYGLFPEQKKQKLLDRKRNFLSIQQNYSTFTKLSKDISKMGLINNKKSKI